MDHQTLSTASSDYRETIDWLFDLQFVGIKMGLENIRSLAAFWEHPQRRYPIVHVAGTNGKGSTASFIAAGLQAAGYRTGLYTSPHLVDFSERIRVDGVPITEQRVVEYTRALRAEIERLSATFFEATTLMAFRHFADEGVDVAIVETGLGGRLDATNVVDPTLTVITSISVEHTEYLGDTLAEIAAEKAGIIKPGAPCVVARQEQEALDVLRRSAAAAGTSLHETGGWKSDLRILDSGGMECRLPGFTHPVEVGFAGPHQVENAATAVTALRLLRERGFPRLSEDCISEGLRNVRRLGGLRGRLEVLQRKPLLAVDVGHNPDGIRAMLEAWSVAHDIGQTDLVFGVLKNKDLAGIFRILARHSPRSVTLVRAESHEARTLEEMLRLAAEAGIEAEGRDEITTAVREKLASAGEGAVLLFGSHYVVGAFLREWEKKR
jgi:dihydrofolate synthase / folylpolyglutamate synthase